MAQGELGGRVQVLPMSDGAQHPVPSSVLPPTSEGQKACGVGATEAPLGQLLQDADGLSHAGMRLARLRPRSQLNWAEVTFMVPVSCWHSVQEIMAWGPHTLYFWDFPSTFAKENIRE